MNMQLVNEVTKSQLKKDVPFFKSGSTVRVHVKIKEGDKSRIQVFEGLVIAKQGGGINEVFTVRKISNQIGVEKNIPDSLSNCWKKSKLYVTVRLEETNYSTYADVLVRLLVLKKFVKLEKVGSCSTFYFRLEGVRCRSRRRTDTDWKNTNHWQA